jgi:hypothetical protein
MARPGRSFFELEWMRTGPEWPGLGCEVRRGWRGTRNFFQFFRFVPLTPLRYRVEYGTHGGHAV